MMSRLSHVDASADTMMRAQTAAP